MAFVKKKIWHSNEVAWSSPSSQPHRLRYGRAVEEMQKEHAAFSEFVMHHCASKSPVESGDPDISRVALDSRMGNRQGSPGTSSSGPEPALRLAKSSPHRPLSRYLSLSISLAPAHSLSALVVRISPPRLVDSPASLRLHGNIFRCVHRYRVSLPRANRCKTCSTSPGKDDPVLCRTLWSVDTRGHANVQARSGEGEAGGDKHH